MKQIRLLHGVLFLVLACLCCGCGLFGDQEYVCEDDNVESVQIIELNEYIEGEYRYEYTVLCAISDKSEFVKQLNGLKHTVNWGEPSQLDIGYVVIRVGYLNGDYDLIYPNAQCFHRDGVGHYGFFFFDEDEFNELISKYLSQ